LLGLSQEARAFREVPRTVAPTPDRVILTLIDHPGAKWSTAYEALGVRPVSYRSDGTPFLLWASHVDARSPITRSEAEARALAAGRLLATAFNIAGRDLFVIGSTALDEDFVSVTLGQRYLGVGANRGALIVTFVNGQLATVRNDLVIHAVRRIKAEISPQAATDAAIKSAEGIAVDSRVVEDASLEIWTASDRAEDARPAYRVRTRSFSPRTELTVHVDAQSGRILAADDDVRWADGEGRVRISVDSASGIGVIAPFTSKFLSLGGSLVTDGDGDAQSAAPLQATLNGPYSIVQDQSGQAVEQFMVGFGGPFQQIILSPMIASQADAFTYVNYAKHFDMQVMPNNTFLFQQLPTNVNLPQNCNAYFDGQSVNFFQAGSGCSNTARIPSVVYHEFGHGVHFSLSPQMPDGAVGEGTADFHSAHIGNDPLIGRGFMPGNPMGGIRLLTHAKVYPTDVVGEIHADGQIWATSLWDFRTAMIQKYGDWMGKRVAYRSFLRSLAQDPSLATAYPAIIAGDDDDNDPSNGTPNSCELNQIFQAHGLVNGGGLNHTLAGTRGYVQIDHQAPGTFTKSNGSITISAGTQNRSMCGTYNASDLQLFVAPGLTGGTFAQVPLTPDPSMQGASKATVSQFNEGDTFRYYFQLTAGGATFNSGTSAEPHVGVVAYPGTSDIMREGFEEGFGTWTHGTVGSDLVDDWEVAPPVGAAVDPYAAHAGSKAVGTDLAGGIGGVSSTDGIAKAGRHTFLQSVPIPTTGMENVRLELWHQYAISGTLTVLVDAQPVWTYLGDGTSWSKGWRFLSVPLGSRARDNKSGVTIRFEVVANNNNMLGGWTIDDVGVTGTMIPPPPPPPPPPDMNPPPSMNPQPSTTGNPPGQGAMQPSSMPSNGHMPDQENDPNAGAPPNGFTGTVSGGCVCVAPIAGRGPFALAGMGLLVLAGLVRRRRF
jgi:hypothetical protein